MVVFGRRLHRSVNVSHPCQILLDKLLLCALPTQLGILNGLYASVVFLQFPFHTRLFFHRNTLYRMDPFFFPLYHTIYSTVHCWSYIVGQLKSYTTYIKVRLLRRRMADLFLFILFFPNPGFLSSLLVLLLTCRGPSHHFALNHCRIDLEDIKLVFCHFLALPPSLFLPPPLSLSLKVVKGNGLPFVSQNAFILSACALKVNI